MSAPDGLHALVENFRRNQDAYRSGRYNETQVRIDFINPLFEMLGWDVSNRHGNSPAYQDVVHEDAIKVGGAHKAPDYGFRVGGSRKFFVEAKKPSVSIYDNPLPAFQLRRYAWSAKLPLSVLTDFEEFAVYDCRIQPDKEDHPRIARSTFLTYDTYVDNWDQIAATFSREAVLAGSIDTYADTSTSRRGVATVDTVFLKEIESWREMLARDLALANPSLTQRELNFAVQMTIDRIVFLRMTEDRGIEDYGRLRALLNGDHVYERLRDLYRQADERYNSGLFHFHPERRRTERHDDLTPRLTIGDTTLQRIIRSLYYPDSPYEFSVLPIEVLGQVYEQFLGRVIDITPERQVTIEEKPEVRKAGGVYYTPKYIVDYIVEHTVGALLEGKRPGPRGGVSKLRIVDPACGSGSFLIGAYEFLLDWHRDRYIEDGPEKHRKELFQGVGGQWLLTTGEKKRILLNNIYGVDIDPQAVEVTKLSLLLKVLEGETSESIVTQLSMFRERALPDLSNNIKCGNSLIGPDFYDNQQISFLDTEGQYRINVFDWESSFPNIFSGDNPGFDAVIGNPPYVDSEWMSRYHPSERRYCVSHYYSASGNWDLFCIFVEKSIKLCKLNGRASLIVPNKLGSAGYAANARHIISVENRLLSIRDYSRIPVFPVAVYPIVYLAQKSSAGPTGHVLYERMGMSLGKRFEPSLIKDLDYQRYFGVSERPWPIFSDTSDASPIDRIRNEFRPLCKLATVLGAATVSEAYRIQPLIIEQTHVSTDTLKVVNSGTIDRYSVLWGRKRLRYLGDSYLCPILDPNQIDTLPKTRAVQSRTPKIVVAGMTKVLECVADLEGNYLAGKSTTIIITPLDLRYVLAILNSSLVAFYYQTTFGGDSLQGGYLKVGPPQLRTIPMREIDLHKSSERTLHSQAIALVDRMSSLQERINETRTEFDRTIIQRQIEVTDRQIDQLVYKLYGLTDEEIAIVEESS